METSDQSKSVSDKRLEEIFSKQIPLEELTLEEQHALMNNIYKALAEAQNDI